MRSYSAIFHKLRKVMPHHTTAINFFLALTFSLYPKLVGLALSRIPQHSQQSFREKIIFTSSAVFAASWWFLSMYFQARDQIAMYYTNNMPATLQVSASQDYG
jgi:hypothetical protein